MADVGPQSFPGSDLTYVPPTSETVPRKMIAYQTYSSGSLFCVRYLAECRQINGLLAKPPQVFVVHYNEELDQVEVERLSWNAARALAIDDMERIAEAIRQDRLAQEPWRARGEAVAAEEIERRLQPAQDIAT